MVNKIWQSRDCNGLWVIAYWLFTKDVLTNIDQALTSNIVTDVIYHFFSCIRADYARLHD